MEETFKLDEKNAEEIALKEWQGRLLSTELAERALAILSRCIVVERRLTAHLYNGDVWVAGLLIRP